MIYYYANGELGNQLFQYHFIVKNALPNETIIICGFDQLLSYYNLHYKILHIPKKFKLLRIFGLLLSKLFNLLARFGVITFIYPEKINYNIEGRIYIKDGSTIRKKIGFLKNIKLIKSSNYSSDSLFDYSIDKYVKIKERYSIIALETLKPYFDKIKIFVHIRLGDYDKFTVFNKSVKLPIDYYRSAIDLINGENVVFIFCSNNPNAIENQFSNLENKYISRNSAIIDMAIMNNCDGGILSASTFSYFGRYYQKQNNVELTISPKFWYGFNSKIEYPENSFPAFSKALEVEINNI
jgi:hypothetical protein